MEDKIEKILKGLANNFTKLRTFNLKQEISISIEYESTAFPDVSFVIIGQNTHGIDAQQINTVPEPWKSDLENTASKIMDLWLIDGKREQYTCFDNNTDYEITCEIKGTILPVHKRYGRSLSDLEIDRLRLKAEHCEEYEIARIWRDVLDGRKTEML